MSRARFHRWGVRFYRAALVVLPAGFRDRHGAAMVALVDARLAESNGVVAPSLCLLAEIIDLLRTAWSIRLPGLAIPSMAGLALGALVALSVRPPPSAAADSWTVNATDPAGAFTLTVIGDRVVGASVDGAPVAESDIRHDGDTVRIDPLPDRSGVTVRFDPIGRRISWAARSASP